MLITLGKLLLKITKIKNIKNNCIKLLTSTKASFTMKVLIGGTMKLLTVLLIASSSVSAQTDYITNTLGQPVGQVQTIGNTTYVSNVMGAVVSQVQQVNNTLYITNTLGQPVAQVQKDTNAPANRNSR